jgi:DNA-binding response OmpR family regulator
MSEKILLVEDETALAGIIADSLRARGFEVCHIADGGDAYEAYKKERPSLLILDVMLPVENGFTIASKIRLADKHTPILFLTARSMSDDVVEGFTSGGNDYMKKPFDLPELIIRVQVLLNENRLLETSGPERIKGKVEIGSFVFDTMAQTLTGNKAVVKLTAREADVLRILYQYRGRLLTRKLLLESVWGNDDFFTSRTLDVYISKLRRHLKTDPSIKIINQRGFGYKLIF